ncbi:Thioesterase/thiol ester dehydrase-isomerase [Panus rudis PR-1116 ss-1]|nr:Thioesterase/thiol ester dehydrase-isomerase [Panus rudis PR-1116 ss-1]
MSLVARHVRRFRAANTGRVILSGSTIATTYPRRYSHTIRSLQESFRDPNSPFHIPAGKQGPAHPGDHGLDDIEFRDLDREIAREARQTLLDQGYDPASFWEQPVVWGDHDSFQHVNNVRYVRFFESGRIKWMVSLGEEIGGPEKAQAMLKGKGVSLILKSISLNYKRPVTYPDTLLIAHKPHRLPKTHMHVFAVAYSYAQRSIVTESDSVLVWYDYDRLVKCDPGVEVRAVIEGRMALGKENIAKAAARRESESA